MRDETAVRRDARLWTLIAELEALKCERLGMEINGQYPEQSFYEVAAQMREVKKQLEEV